MILEVARDLDDSGLEFPRYGYARLELLRIKRRRLRDARARAEQQREKHRATAQTRQDDVVGPQVSSNLSPGCYDSHACFLATYRRTFARPSEGVIDTRLPIWTSIARTVNPPPIISKTRRAIYVYAIACSTVSHYTVGSRGPDFGWCTHRRYKWRGLEGPVPQTPRPFFFVA